MQQKNGCKQVGGARHYMKLEKKISEKEIIEITKCIELIWQSVDKEKGIEQVNPPALANTTSLVFVSSEDDLKTALDKGSAIIIVLGTVWKALSNKVEKGIISIQEMEQKFKKQTTLLTTPNISMAMAEILPLFDFKLNKLSEVKGIHPSAFVDSTAKIGSNVKIAPFAYVGKDCLIGDNSIIGPHCTLEMESQVGEFTTLHASVFVGTRCRIGNHCEIHPNTTIGSDGFGYFSTGKGSPQKIPQIGNVLIEDFVEIGSCCSIDRATLTSTKIKSGTKLDNLIHIAHNCEIGENGMIAAGFMMAGSTKIGRNFMTGGNSVVTGHIEIADGVVLAGRSTVTKSILESGSYGGYPLEPLKDALKTLANLSNLSEMRKILNKVVKHLNLEK